MATPSSLGGNQSTSMSANSFSFTITNQINVGDLVVIGVYSHSTVTSISDGANLYQRLQLEPQSTVNLELWYCISATSSRSLGATITAHFAATTTQAGIVGASLSSLVQVDTSAANTGTSISSLSVTSHSLQQANEIAFGLALDFQLHTPTPTSGFTQIASAGNYLVLFYDNLVSALPVTFSFSVSPNSDILVGIVGTFMFTPTPFVRRGVVYRSLLRM